MRYSYKTWVKIIKIQVKLNTTTTLNVREMVTLMRMQQARCIVWAQFIYNHLCMMTRTNLVMPTMPKNTWRIAEIVGGLGKASRAATDGAR